MFIYFSVREKPCGFCFQLDFGVRLRNFLIREKRKTAVASLAAKNYFCGEIDELRQQ